MQPTTEACLLEAIRHANATAYTAFVTGHLGMVHSLAKRIAGRGNGLDELVATGRVVLCEEARLFAEHRHECRFSTYAHTRIWRALVSAKRHETLLKGTEWQARRAKQERTQKTELCEKLGECPRCQTPTYQDAQGRCVVCGEVCWAYFASEEDLEMVYGRRLAAADARPVNLSSDAPELNREATREWARETEEAAQTEERQQRYARLPAQTRQLLSECLELAESSNGVSLAAVAEQKGIPRQWLAEELLCAMGAR